METLIIDSGSNQITCGFNDENYIKTRNIKYVDKATGKSIFGKQSEDLLYESNYAPIKTMIRGILINFETQIQIWDNLLQNMGVRQDIQNYSLIQTIQLFSPNQVKQKFFETAFEYWGVNNYLPINPQKAIQQFVKQEDQIFQLIVESSDSGTYIVPFFDDQILNQNICKLEVGGRLLTKHLKQIISFRQLNLTNETFLIQQIKEQMCFISTNFKRDMSISNSYKQYFILPQSDINKKGYVSQDLNSQYQDAKEQSIFLSQERFCIPELLFNPQDIGLQQNNVCQSIQNCINNINFEIRDNFYSNIFITGGNFRFKNTKQRMFLYFIFRENDIISIIPDHVELNIQDYTQIDTVFKGCQQIAKQQNFLNNCINKQDYQEIGYERLSQIYLV